MKRYRIALDITTKSPLHISSMKKGRFLPGEGRIQRYPSKEGSEASLTITMPICRGSSAERNTQDIPIIPASTLGGKLRRMATALIGESAVVHGKSMSVDAYNTLTSGSPTSTLKAAVSADTINAAMRHPFFGLFGGTTLALHSNTVICDGLPLIEVTKDMLMTEPLAPVPDMAGYEMLTPVQIIRKNDVSSMENLPLQEALIGKDAIASYLVSEMEKSASRRANKASQKEAMEAGEKVEAGKKETLQTATAIEAVAPGAQFGLRFEIRAATPAHLGLFIMALQRMIKEGQLGGKGARGFGRYYVHASNICAEENDSPTGWGPCAALFGSETEAYTIKSDKDWLQNAVVNAQDWIDSCDLRLIEAFAAGAEKDIRELTTDKKAA